MTRLFERRFVCFISLIIVMNYSCRWYFKTTTDHFEAKKNTDSFERGKNLAFNICAGCHCDQKVGKFIGKSLNDLPKMAGHLYSANLTQSKTNGLPPQYSDAELFYLLKTGISKTGKFTPYMMRPMMADEDINDIIVYLRSNDAAVSAADTTVGLTHINFIGKTGIRFATKPQQYNKGVQKPDENNPVAYGRYLVAVIGCYHCHSKKVLGLDYSDPEKTKRLFARRHEIKRSRGQKIVRP